MSAQSARPGIRLPAFVIGCLVLVGCLLALGTTALGAWLFSRAGPPAPEPAVEYLLDASPRMALATEGGTRLSVAQAVLAEIVRPADPSLTAGLRVFGTGELADACQDTRLVVPLAPANQDIISTQLAALQAGPAADAAMAQAMIAAIRDLATARGPHTLVVVTGGQDSCNPQAGQLLAEEAGRAGIALELFVVGYQVPATEAEAIRTLVAGTTGAQYLEAQDENGLRAILKAIQQRVDNRGSLPLAAILATARAVAALPSATPSPQISREAAAQLVLDQVLRPDTLDHEAIVFVWPEPLGSDDVLAPYAYPPFGLPAEPIAIASESWFFWIDDFPNGLFEHPNRYVLVERASGALTVSDETWWPVLNGEGLWLSAEDYWNEANWVFDNFAGQPREAAMAGAPHQARLARVPPPQGVGGLGLVLNGWLPDQPGELDLALDSQQMIGVLSGAGLPVTYLGPPLPTEVAAAGVAELNGATLAAALQRAATLAPGETLLLYATGHAGRAPNGGYIAAGFDLTVFQQQLAALDAGVDVVLVFEGSYSGLVVSALLPVVDRIITATESDTPAARDADHPADPDPADRGSEFTSAFAAQFGALSGSEAGLLEAFNRSAATGRSRLNVLAELAYGSSLAADSNAVRGVTAPQMAPANLPIAENESPVPADRLSGTYTVQSSYHSGNREHLCCIPMPQTFELRVGQAPLLFEGPEPWVGMTGELNADGSFSVQRAGTVAGFSDVLVTFEGTLTDAGLNGLYTFGADGKLPGGQPITFAIMGQQTARASAPAVAAAEKVEDFVPNFVAARQSNFVPFLLSRLDPAVIEIYGEAVCRAELERRGPDTTFALRLSQVPSAPELWVYAVDGRSAAVVAYRVEAELTSAGETGAQTLHFGVAGGRLTWFTDCGDPPQ